MSIYNVTGHGFYGWLVLLAAIPLFSGDVQAQGSGRSIGECVEKIFPLAGISPRDIEGNEAYAFTREKVVLIDKCIGRNFFLKDFDEDERGADTADDDLSADGMSDKERADLRHYVNSVLPGTYVEEEPARRGAGEQKKKNFFKPSYRNKNSDSQNRGKRKSKPIWIRGGRLIP